MDISLEPDADALWQDTIDLLANKQLPTAFLCMLRECVPVGVEDDTLLLKTHARTVCSQVQRNAAAIEEGLSAVAFVPMVVNISYAPTDSTTISPSSMTESQTKSWSTNQRDLSQSVRESAVPASSSRPTNPLVETIPQSMSKLTFGRFVRGEENDIAYQAAVQVANGVNASYNPLFIYGKSGLGKTHLLRAIQNYVSTNDPSRICVYREGTAFINDYTDAMSHREQGAAEALRHNYAGVDILIIDDIQQLVGKVGTISFFFDTFNDLINNGKQIVLAADRSPSELGMGKDSFDERITSRLGSGFPAPINAPNYELKLLLIQTFCARLREDASREGVSGLSGTINADTQQHMAHRAGTNIRMIEGFCQRCLFAATSSQKEGKVFSTDQIDIIASEIWSDRRNTITIDDVQKCIERRYDISHDDLAGSKRTHELAVPRHIAIWLARELCDRTLADIGRHFGGRTHATVKHSISYVETNMKEDRLFFDNVMQIKDTIERET